MAWWNATSVTISNNQNVVVVNAADNIGLINDGDALVLAGQIVEIDRAYFDNNNAPRILLKSNWTFGNQTNQPAKAVPIPADLRRAVQYLRDVGQDAITFSEAMAQILSSTAATLVIPTATSGDVTVVPYGRLVQQVNDLLATMGTFGVPLYGTNSKNQARTLMGLQPQVTAQPTLDLDFANNEYRVYEPFGLTRKTLTEAIATTRTSVATYNSPFGIAAAAANVPRIEYNPATGEALGLLCEEQRTNLLLWSEQFDNAIWTKNSSTVTANSTLAPDGTVSADLLLNNSGQRGFIQQTATASATAPHSFSLYVKSAGAKEVRMQTVDAANSGCRVTFNFDSELITSQNIGTNGTGHASFVQNLSDGWYKITVVGASTVTGNSRLSQISYAKTSYSQPASEEDGTSGIYIWGAQLEAGSFPTSYIKTEGSQVTRSGDRFLADFVMTKEGVFYVDTVTAPGPIGYFSSYLALVTGGNHLAVSNPSNSDIIRLATSPSTSTNIQTTVAPNTRVKIAVRWTATNLTLVINGAIIGSSTHTGLANYTKVSIGGLSETANAGSKRTCKEVKCLPRALSDQELIDLTRI